MASDVSCRLRFGIATARLATELARNRTVKTTRQNGAMIDDVSDFKDLHRDEPDVDIIITRETEAAIC